MSVAKLIYPASRIKRKRATKAEMLLRRQAVLEIVQRINPCTVRQAFYRSEIASIVEKTEGDYDKVQDAIVWLRHTMDAQAPYVQQHRKCTAQHG
jgi:hypothetical protein